MLFCRLKVEMFCFVRSRVGNISVIIINFEIDASETTVMSDWAIGYYTYIHAYMHTCIYLLKKTIKQFKTTRAGQTRSLLHMLLCHVVELRNLID